MSSDHLFSGPHWFDVDRHQREELKKEVGEIDGDRLLNTSVEDLVKYLAGKYQITVPALVEDEIVVEQHDTQIDVSRDSMRIIHDRSRPFHVKGTEIQVEVPFTGEAEAFRIHPSSYDSMPPRAAVRQGRLYFSVSGTNLEPTAVRAEIDRTLKSIKWYLEKLAGDVLSLNNQLPEVARGVVQRRREKLLGDRTLVASLGFKMKERPGAAKTFVAPEVRRKLHPVMPESKSKPYVPEPTLAPTDYEHVLTVVQNMAHVMELSPSAFVTTGEEALRSHFLVQLNGHYEGNATGETFNFEGKTDILIKSAGRNIFIAECKFWDGPKKLTETLDQLLGYSSWRDTKTAVILFSRNRDFSKVLAAIPPTVQAHPQHKADLPGSTETVFRYRFAHRDDANREMYLTVLAFNVPSPQAQ
jgi:hypothetical protein